MSEEYLPKLGSKIIVHNPDGISRRKGKVKSGDIGKVIGYIDNDRVLAFNPEWFNEIKPEYAQGWTHNGPCVVLWKFEFRVGDSL